jgi:hypothetical protein
VWEREGLTRIIGLEMTEVSRHVIDMIDGDHGLSHQRFGVRVSPRQTLQWPDVSRRSCRGQLSSTLRGTARLTEFSMVF